MSRLRLGRRWAPALLVTAILAVGTLGLRHVCSDAHADGLSPECLTCRVVTSSTATLKAHPSLCESLTVRDAEPLAHDEHLVAAVVAAPLSRGPPSSC